MATGTLNRNTTNKIWDLSVDAGSVTSSDVTKTLTLETAGKYVDENIKISFTAKTPGAGAFKANDTTVTIPSDNITIGSTATGGAYPINVASTTATTSSVSTAAGYIANGVAGTSGTATASGTGSVTQSTLKNGTTTINSGSSITANNGTQTINIGAGYYPSARTVKINPLSSGAAASLANTASNGVTYTPNTSIVLGQANTDGTTKYPTLYINAGYIGNTSITLDQLLEGSTDNAATLTDHILSGKIAYDVDGNRLVGSMGNASISGSGSAQATSPTIAQGEAYTTDNTYKATRISSTPSETKPTSGYYIATKATAPATTDIAVKQSAATTGYVNLAANATIGSASTTQKVGNVYYSPIAAATFEVSGASVYCKTAGYVPQGSTSNVLKTIGNGTIVNNSSAISSVGNTSGSTPTATVDTTNWKLNISVPITASGTAAAKGGTSGYITSSTTWSTSISKTGTATAQVDVYSGSYTLV